MLAWLCCLVEEIDLTSPVEVVACGFVDLMDPLRRCLLQFIREMKGIPNNHKKIPKMNVII